MHHTTEGEKLNLRLLHTDNTLKVGGMEPGEGEYEDSSDHGCKVARIKDAILAALREGPIPSVAELQTACRARKAKGSSDDHLKVSPRRGPT